MLRGDEAVGALLVTRPEPGPFLDKQVELLRTFADQAVIAIENVRLFQELREKTVQLEIADRHKSEFLANMSHELRTPLNAIIGFSEVLLERMFGDLNDKQQEYLEDVLSSGRHLLSLINDILDLSKIEAGRMELELGPFDLPLALDNALTLVKERAARHGIGVTLEVGPGVGSLVGDERKIKQVVLNLLSNAVKFTGRGGFVAVVARRDRGELMFSVTDTGIGIADTDLKQLGNPFFQAHSSYDRPYEGTGLGLSVVKGLVELHGGRVEFASRIGEGTSVRVCLPLVAVSATAPAAVEQLPSRSNLASSDKVKRSA
jgi:signal transduction histidine kinase